MKVKVYSRGREAGSERELEGMGELEKGIFETLRAYEGKIFRLEEHLERFQDSARSTGFQCPLTMKELIFELEQALQSWLKSGEEEALPGDVVSLRLTAWEKHVRVLIGKRALSPELFTEGIRLQTSAVRRSHINAASPESKTNAYQNAVLAMFEPEPKPDERLFLDPEGWVAEASIGNIFMVKKNALLTPPARGILNGVTRRFVLECADSAEISTSETPLTRHELYNADEIFLTNTSWEILPVREIDGRSFTEAVPGPLTRKLHSIFKKRIQLECRKSSSAAR